MVALAASSVVIVRFPFSDLSTWGWCPLPGDEAAFPSDAALHASYSGWCEENGVKPKGLRAGEVQWDSGQGKTVRGCRGVRFK